MIGSERPPEALAQYTGFLMNWVARRSRDRFAEALEAEVGLHPREFGVLAVVERDPGITQQAIGEAAGVDKETLGALSKDERDQLNALLRKLAGLDPAS